MKQYTPRWDGPQGTFGSLTSPTSSLSPTRPISRDSAISLPLFILGCQQDHKRYGLPHVMEEDCPKVLGIHHLKFAVSNLDVSIAWYERVMGARRVASLDHFRSDGSRFAVVLEMPDWGGLYVELRHTTEQAIKQRGWDPVTLSVKDKADLEHWVTWLNRWGTSHSPLMTGPRGWILVFEDPDRRRIRLYTREQHRGTESPSVDDDWLAEM